MTKEETFMGKLIYLGHASFLIKSKDFSVVVDPYRNNSVPNMTLPKIEEVDAVFCSHDHYDHDAKGLIRIKKNPYPVKPISIKVPHDDCGGAKRGMNDINMFDIDGFKVVHLGDTGCVLDEKTLAPIKNCDILLAPINGYYTIGPKELKALCDVIKPRIIIPMHYFMQEYQSGYPDGNMIDLYKKLFPNYQYLDNEELDLDAYKQYHGSLLFKKYLQ